VRRVADEIGLTIGVEAILEADLQSTCAIEPYRE
jgi:hypothetical protein